MAKSAAAGKAAAKMGKKELRAMADKLGVKWDKQTDTEEGLRAKVDKALAKDAPKAEKAVAEEEAQEAPGTGFNLTERAPTGSVLDPKTGKVVREPADCFGWYFDKTSKRCSKECPHAKACAVHSKGAAEAIEALQAEDEAAEVTPEEAAEGATAHASRKGKGKAKGKATTWATEGTIEEDTPVSVLFDMEFVDLLEDDDLRKFYRRVLRAAPGGATTAGKVVDLFGAIYEVEDRSATLTSLIKTMVGNTELKVS